jgi:putative endopeptidase
MRLLFRLLCATSVIAACPAFAADPAPVTTAPRYGTFGFDEAGMNRSVAPGDDFYGFANGTWSKNTPIPADKPSFALFSVLDDLSNQRTRDILEEAGKKPDSKIGAFYASFMDEATIEAKGLAPVKPTLDSIAAIASKAEYAKALGVLTRIDVNGPIGASVGIDDKDPDSASVSITQAGLGLPDRDYYLKPEPEMAKIRAAYEAYLAQLLTLAGGPEGAARAKAIVAFETEIAKGHWTRTESRDSDKTYNPWARTDFEKKAPGFDWGTFFTIAGLEGQKTYIVAQPSAITAAAKLIDTTALGTLKDYLWVRTLDKAAPYLSHTFVDANFAFHGTVLSGIPQNRDRWKRGVNLVKGGMGEAVGKDYVAKWFPPETKAAADALVHNVIAAMHERLEKLPWMSPETKQRALAKLASFRPKIGYPDKWIDYSLLNISRDDLYGNVMRANLFEYQRNLDKLGHPLDRGEWGMTPMEINAYANPVWNEIVFPAAILQPPFFDPKADPAVNYGGIGAVIGHEMSHHFDDQGRKYDEHGRLADWWTPQDISRFTALTDKLVKEYDAYEPLPGLHVNGSLTLGENIADLAGLTVAYDAYHVSLGGKPAPVIDGFTGDQRFYLGWAQVWRNNVREQRKRQLLMIDPHSPSEQRVAVVRNLDPWYSAFKPKPGQKLYLAPDGRVRIW